VPPGTLNPRVSPALDAVVMRALAKDRFERYQSAAEFRQDLETTAAGAVPVKKQLATNDFNSTLFGVNPSAVAGSEATLRQLTVDEGNRAVRTQTRPPVAWIWVGIASMIAIIAAVIFWTFSLTPPQLAENVAVDVPTVAGQTWAEGSGMLTDAGLEPERLEESSDTVDVDVIIRTDPEAGVSVPPGTQVRVYVSTGKTAVTVPDVARMSEAAAIESITGAGLTYGSSTAEYSPDLAAGTVTRSDPGAGSSLRKGDPVNLVVSNGLVSVPDVTGQTIAAASSTLQALQLSIRVDIDGGCTGGTVSRQSILGEQPQKSQVTLTYCGG
jgi:eukaryotic-like serine/threonine-protein kinase